MLVVLLWLHISNQRNQCILPSLCLIVPSRGTYIISQTPATPYSESGGRPPYSSYWIYIVLFALRQKGLRVIPFLPLPHAAHRLGTIHPLFRLRIKVIPPFRLLLFGVVVRYLSGVRKVVDRIHSMMPLHLIRDLEPVMLLQPFGLDLYSIPDETVGLTSSDPRSDSIGLCTYHRLGSFVHALSEHPTFQTPRIS